MWKVYEFEIAKGRKEHSAFHTFLFGARLVGKFGVEAVVERVNASKLDKLEGTSGP